MKTIDLGWCMARLDTNDNMLVIVAPADMAEYGYMPPASIHVYGTPALIALRDALNEAYPKEIEVEK